MRKIIEVILTCFIIPLLFLSIKPVGILNLYPWITYALLVLCVVIVVNMNITIKKIGKDAKYAIEAMPLFKHAIIGRDDESNQLATLLKKKNNTQLILVKGEGGIGKTSLVSSYISKNKKQHDLIIWQPLSDMPTTREIINFWLSIYNETIPEIALNARIDEFIRQIKKNKQENILIVFDNVESLIEIDNNNSMHFSNDFILLLSRLININGIQKKIILTTAVDLGNILPPLCSKEVIELDKLNESVLQKIIADRTSQEISLNNVGMACGNPSAALLLAGIAGDENISGMIVEQGEKKSLIPLVDKRLQMLSTQEQLLVLFLCIVKIPLSKIEIQRLWCLVPPYNALDPNEIEKLRQVYVVERLSNGKIVINPIVAEIIINRITDDLAAVLVGNPIASTSLIHAFPLDFAKFSAKVRTNANLRVFPDTCKKVEERFSVSTSLIDIDKLINNLTNFETDEEYDFLFSNVVMFLLYSGKDLDNLTFPNMKLYGVDFSQTHLFNIDLCNVQLRDCVFADRNGSAYATCFMKEDVVLVGLASGSIELRDRNDLKRIKRVEAHYEPVRAVYYSPKYNSVLSAGEDGIIVIYDSSLEIINSFKAHLCWIWRILPITERYVVSIACDGNLGLIDLETNTLIRKMAVQSQRIWDADILNDELYLVTEEGIIWKQSISNILQQDTNEWKMVTTVSTPIKTCCVCSNSFIFGCRDCTLYKLDAQGVSILLSKENGCIRDLCSIPNSNRVITVGDTGTAYIYDVVENSCIGEKKIQASRTWQVDVCGSMAVTVGDDRTIHLWDVDDLSSIKISSGNGQSLRNVDLFNGNYVFACADDFLRYSDGKNIYPWISMEPRKRILGFVGLENEKWACSFDSGEIAFGQKDTIRQIRKEHANAIESIARNTNGTLFATGGEDRIIKVFDSDGKPMLSPKPLHSSRIWALSFSYDNKILASAGGDFIIALWNVADGQLLANCVGHNNLILSICWLDNERIVSAGTDGTIRLWEAKSGKPLLIKPISGLIRDLTTDGKNTIYGVGRIIGTTSGWFVLKWDVNTNAIQTNILPDLGGSARTVVYEEDTLMIGGDMPFWLQVCSQSLKMISKQRIPGIYSGTKIRQENLYGADSEILKLLGADIL